MTPIKRQKVRKCMIISECHRYPIKALKPAPNKPFCHVSSAHATGKWACAFEKHCVCASAKWAIMIRVVSNNIQERVET